MRKKARRMKNLVLSTYGDRCVYCGEEADTIDHYVPIRKGGDNSIANLRPACSACNMAKGDSLPEEFMRSAGRPIPVPHPGGAVRRIVEVGSMDEVSYHLRGR
jgi:5-methylcytosine-specific restriction endonuclease McrA